MKHVQQIEESAGQMAGQVSSSQAGGLQLASEQARGSKVPSDNAGCGRVGGPEAPSVSVATPQLSSTPAPKLQSPSRLKRCAQVGFLVAGMAILLVPALTTPLTLSEESAEKRELAPAPSLIENGHVNNQFLAQAGAWFEDHFGFRNEIIGANALLMKNLFHESASDRVIMGKDNWLYYEGTLPDYMGTNRYTERQVYATAHNIALMQEYIKKRGGRLEVMLVPNKNTLYPEQMPERFVKSTERHNMDRVEDVLIKQGLTTFSVSQLLQPPSAFNAKTVDNPYRWYGRTVPLVAPSTMFDWYLEDQAQKGVIFERDAGNVPDDMRVIKVQAAGQSGSADTSLGSASGSEGTAASSAGAPGAAGGTSTKAQGSAAGTSPAQREESAAGTSSPKITLREDAIFPGGNRSGTATTFDERVKYLAHDTHWNDEGAYIAARTLLNNTWVGDLRIKSVEQGSQVGDLERMLFPAFASPEKSMSLKTVVNPIDMDRLKKLPGGIIPIFAADDTKEWDQYEISGPVDAGLVTTHGQGTKRLYAYRDSFANALIPMLAPAFSEAEFSKAIPYDLTVLDKFKPDLVLIERAERHLGLFIEEAPIMPAPSKVVYAQRVQKVQGRTLTLKAQESGAFVLISGEVPADALDDRSVIYFASKLNGEELYLDSFQLPSKEAPGAFVLRVPTKIWEQLRESASVVVSRGNHDEQYQVIFE